MAKQPKARLAVAKRSLAERRPSYSASYFHPQGALVRKLLRMKRSEVRSIARAVMLAWAIADAKSQSRKRQQ